MQTSPTTAAAVAASVSQKKGARGHSSRGREPGGELGSEKGGTEL